MRHTDDEEETPKRRWRLMHFTMVMLALLLFSKVSMVMSGVHELVSVREARASSAEAEEEKPAEEAPSANRTKAQEADISAKGLEAKAAAEATKKEAAANEEGGDEAGGKKDDAHEEEAKEEDGHGGEKDKAPKEEMTHGEGKLSVKQVEALKEQGGAPQAFTQTEIDLLQNLSKRRDELEAREAELELKSKVLDATEKRINDKVTEMKTLQGELSTIVAQYKEHQDSEIKSLVKIYENMKPGDAAAIFNEMDMPILLEVIGKMSERKVAPVLAGMNPKRARDVTQELAEMRHGQSATGAAANAVAP
jgi:flagellar motility protein MotE (MotC chaperone)